VRARLEERPFLFSDVILRRTQHSDGLRCRRPTDYLHASRTREYGDVPTSATTSRLHSVRPASLPL
jgi:hypothetical protein